MTSSFVVGRFDCDTLNLWLPLSPVKHHLFHLPPERPVIDVATEGEGTTWSSIPSSLLELAVKKLGGKFGSVASLSRYCITSRMHGLSLGSEWEHRSPSFSTNSTSSVTWPCSNLGSMASVSEPVCHVLNT